MADNTNKTIFQRLGDIFTRRGAVPDSVSTVSNMPSDTILFSTNDKAAYEQKLAQLKQEKLLARQWVRAGNTITYEEQSKYTATQLMYRDADLMDMTPEIGAALDIIADEICTMDSKGRMLTVQSKSGRVKSILEDLFFNRLNITTWLHSIARGMTKYGNEFYLLNVSKEDGIIGWRRLPVYEINRIENGSMYPYGTGGAVISNEIAPDSVQFVWLRDSLSIPYQEWQIAHFRLLNDSFFLPYGTSHLHKARRAWRMWSMMEDSMLIHRLDKSIERRIFKIFVGGIDDADVQAYVQQVANTFKRTPLIDPNTGQVDLRKNFLDTTSDFFIPVRDMNAPSPIETLQGANSQLTMEDVEYMQNKMFAAMRVPKSFLNFQEAQGKGQNLAFLDTRFSKMITRFQQCLLLELQKIAMVHLYLLGMEDDLSNFVLLLNNASSQTKSAELDDITKRISTLQTALADPGNGIPMMSMHKGLKEIMGMTDSEIKKMLLEIRLEKAMAAELANTQAIIKSTGMFDNIDRIYGDFDAMNGAQQPQPPQGGDMGGGLPGGGGGGGLPPMPSDMGGDFDMDMGEPGAETEGSISGNENVMDMEKAPEADNGGPLMEQSQEKVKSYLERYFDMLAETAVEDVDYVAEPEMDLDIKSKTILEHTTKLMDKMDDILSNTITD